MIEEHSETAESSRLNLDWLVSNLRWLWLFVAALFLVGDNLLSGGPTEAIVPQLIVVAAGFVLNAIFAGLLWAKFFPEWLAITSVALDAVLVAILLAMVPNPLLLLPVAVFPALVAGARWSFEVGLIVAVVVMIGFGLPLVEQFRDGAARDEAIRALVGSGIGVLTLVLAAIVPGLFLKQRIDASQVENEREIEQLRVENARGKLVSKMAATLSSTLDYRQVLRATIDSAFTAMAQVGTKDDSTVAMVLLFDGGEGRMVVASGRNISRRDQGRHVEITEGLIARTVNTAEVTINNRVNRDKSISVFSSTPGCRSAICAPLRAGFQTYGVILFCSTEADAYNEDHKDILGTFCSQAIIALQNAQLFEDVHREQQRILEKESEARRKLARDLHDGPTQSVAAIVMRLNFIKMVLEKRDLDKALDEVVKVEEIAERTTHEIRTMLFAMRPVLLETQGLVPALNQYAERLNKNEPFRVKILSRGYNGQLAPEAEGVIFAIVEEAVGNAKKHAQASEIKINVVARETSLFVEVRDNGVGFDVDETRSTYDQRTSLGLINMDERAEIVGGHCALKSAPGKGTAVQVEIPFDGNLRVE
jgi:signal transduction histidine kinase